MRIMEIWELTISGNYLDSEHLSVPRTSPESEWGALKKIWKAN